MPRRKEAHPILPRDRRREVASILAKGVVRWHRKVKALGNVDAQESSPDARNCLEFPGETRLSASDGTRGLRLRDEGDDA